ncbi:Coatomer subunit zeta-2 [Tupaia chinensis]|uniref:Coatomer subunit zeta n=1 Tax=Tupaia chinensis TaxID=246437 RepID=L8Y9K8_TUPCH|nr:Coatomer subunit zeta-2 [Tupaia chinensis]
MEHVGLVVVTFVPPSWVLAAETNTPASFRCWAGAGTMAFGGRCSSWPGEIAFFGGMTIVYKSSIDLFLYVVGSSHENELMLMSVLTCLFESLNHMLSVILESDPQQVIQKVNFRLQMQEPEDLAGLGLEVGASCSQFCLPCPYTLDGQQRRAAAI